MLVVCSHFFVIIPTTHALPDSPNPSTTNYNTEEQKSQRQLWFRDDGSFKIVVFTDLHYGEGESLDAQNDALQKTVLDAENPDLVVYLGDVVSGWKASGKRGWMKGMLERALGYSNEQGYLHALLLGNHDDEADLNREEILLQDIEISNSMGNVLSLTQLGPLDITGASNYYLDVLNNNSNNSNNQVDARLWFFDSMNRGCEDDSNSWGCVGVSTVEWMKNTSQSIPKVMQSVGFVHIPVPEHRLGYGDFRATGVRQEDSACPTVNTGLAKQLVMHNVSMLVSGHDHQNDFVGNVYVAGKDVYSAGEKSNTTTMFHPGSGARQYGDVPLLMAYGRKSGYGSYGPGNIARGARVIRLETVTTPFEDVPKESRSSLPWYPFYSYWSLTPQMMHDGPFYKMQTWVRNEFGSREDEARPGFKYEVQPECYNGSEGKRVMMVLVFVAMAWFF